MKLIVLYRPNSEFARGVEQYVREFHDRTGKDIELLNIDTPDGISKMKLYDVLDHPTFLALDNSGSLLQKWSGNPLPLINELSAYGEVK
ncbi:MAG: hypothetical protein U0413_03935 [Candidatus Saccharimonadales bacterium]